jgi:hypothetical protein
MKEDMKRENGIQDGEFQVEVAESQKGEIEPQDPT